MFIWLFWFFSYCIQHFGWPLVYFLGGHFMDHLCPYSTSNCSHTKSFTFSTNVSFNSDCQRIHHGLDTFWIWLVMHVHTSNLKQVSCNSFIWKLCSTLTQIEAITFILFAFICWLLTFGGLLTTIRAELYPAN